MAVLAAVLAATVLAGNAWAQSVKLPRTGQTKCWDEAATEISCAGTGQYVEIDLGLRT